MRMILFLALAAALPALSQVPPSRGEAARYSGLHAAAHKGEVVAIARLLAAGADVNVRDAYAAVADDEETLRLLLSLGASAKLVTSRYDGTTLIAAAHLGHDGVVKQLIAVKAPGDGGPRHQETLRALIAAGADLQLPDRQGNTPRALARARGYRAMAEMLERAGAR